MKTYKIFYTTEEWKNTYCYLILAASALEATAEFAKFNKKNKFNSFVVNIENLNEDIT